MVSNHKIWRLLPLSLMVVLLASCEKFLEEEPKNSTYNEVFWDDARAGNNAIAGNYALMRNALMDGFSGVGNRYYMYGDMTANMYIGVHSDGYGHNEIGNGNYTSNYMVQSYGNWTLFYKSITMSNIILKEMPLVPEDVLLLEQDNPEAFRQKIMGQAYFLRAFTYFMLTKVWGDVPLVTEAYDDPINAPQLPRSPRADVLKQIEDDCHKAAALLDWGYTNSSERAVIANKGSVYALLAHMYLWRATTSDLSSNQPEMRDVFSADTTILTLLTEGGYSQADTANYHNIFIGRSSEGIFELNMSENTLEGTDGHIGMKFLNNNYIPTYGADAAFFVKPGYLTSHFYELKAEWQWVWHADIAQWVWEEVLVNALDTKDIRFRSNFEDYSAERPVCVKYSNVIFRNPGQELEPHLSNNMTLFRLSDILLLQAEIALYQGNMPRAIEVINGFREHYGASETSLLTADMSEEKIMTEYILERGKELYLEGHLFFDLVRTRKCFDYVPWLTDTRFKQGGFFWPVDPRLFSENRYLVQTEYWRGKI